MIDDCLLNRGKVNAMAKLLNTLGPEQRAQLMALLHQKEEIAAPN